MNLERRSHFTDLDRAGICWLWQPLPPPPVRPFDLEACIKATKKWFTKNHQISAPGSEFPLRMTPEEAWFWMLARKLAVPFAKRADSHKAWEEHLRAEIAEKPIPENPQADPTVLATLGIATLDSPWFSVLAGVLSPVEIAEDLIAHKVESSKYKHCFVGPNLLGNFADRVLSHLSIEQREQFRAAMASRHAATTDQESPKALLALGFLSLVRGGVELETYLANVGANLNELVNLRTLAGLADEATFVREARRIGVPSPLIFTGLEGSGGACQYNPVALARIWTIATEWRQTDLLLQMVLGCTAKDTCADLANLLALVEAPEVAPVMLEIQLHSKAGAVAREWLSTYPLHTAVGLAPVAMGNGKLATAAREILHNLRRTGQLHVLEAATPHLSDPVQQWLRREIIESSEELLEEATRQELPAALADSLKGSKPGKLPPWLQTSTLKPIRIQNKRLAASDLTLVLTALKDSPIGSDPNTLICQLKTHAAPNSLDLFAWSLFEQWLTIGAPSKDKWAMGALGHFGGDTSALKLTPLIRDWPGESQHQRAVFGLEVLRSIGSDTALMALNGISQKSSFKGLKDKAQSMMDAIAATRGLTREQLADRIVPDCGLDSKGSRIFDFGPRQFKFVLGEKPMVRDPAGKVRPDLPAPNSSDDKHKAEAAVAEWKLLKKTLKEVLKIQAARMEDAMITGRRWTADEFRQFFVHHPLQVNLARQLVFGSYRDDGVLTKTFRITEDQTLADCHDRPLELPAEPTFTIGVVHPAHLDEPTKSAWGLVFSDYEIIPPFPQLGREICRPEPADLELDTITRFKGPKIPGIIVYGILERCQWLRETPESGAIMHHSKFFPAANITAFIHYTGMSIGYYEEDQEIEAVYFISGPAQPEDSKKLPIKDVDPVILSEVLRVVRAIIAKAG